MRSTEILKHEHQIILLVLGAAEHAAQVIQETGTIDAAVIEKMVDFFKNFADRCHHAKEEKLLFLKLQERGMPVEGGPIGVMLQEHEEGRGHVRAVAEALPRMKQGDATSGAAVREHLQAFVALLREHINKEEQVLFSMADQLCTPQDDQALTEAFEKAEAEEMGEGVHEKYHQLAHDLAGTVPRTL